jgi:glycosyltransferase involved in cell wall biosynthesis
MKKIVLFYKKLIEPGGAERLLLNEYIQFKKNGYEVDIVSFKIEDIALFGENVNDSNKIILGDTNWLSSIQNFIKYMNKNKKSIYLCASGHIEIYIASLFSKINYSLHIHHPSFMSFNETDKYSLFQRKYFTKMLNSNFGASRFEDIFKNMPLMRKVYINLRAFISIKAIKNSENNFVLSRYTQNEKKSLFDIESYVLCGALDDSIFEYQVNKDFTKYDKYKYKILTIARLDENKRIDELLVAFKDYLLIEPNSIFFIGGRGTELQNLKSLTKALILEKNVEYLDFIPEDEIFDWYAMADIFVSIDWADYRITMYESLAMNTKVLLSNETDADEFLLKSKYLYVTQPDSKNTTKALELALNEQPNIKIHDLKSYLRNFTWNNYCKKIATILDNKND